MRTRNLSQWRLLLIVSLLPIVGGCTGDRSGPAEQPSVYKNTAPTSPIPVQVVTVAPSPAVQVTPPPVPAPQTLAAPISAAAAETNTAAVQPEDASVVNAPATPVAARTLPPAVRPNSSLAEVIKMADAGVKEEVMLAYVTNSPGIFNLGAEEIIYLNDIGVASGVVTAMIQRDQVLKQAGVAAVVEAGAPTTNPPPGTYAPADTAAPPPQEAPAAAGAAYAPPAAAPSQTTFYDTLSPYGTWVDIDGYGRCWQPTVVVANSTWSPYFDSGRWVYTDAGWYWYSDYSWGWAPFHYGRWFRHNRIGWCWYPGYVWGPSWVTWRYYGDYCGWAALPPYAVYHPGVGFTYHGGSVGFGFSFGLGIDCYSFVSFRNFHGHRFHHNDRIPRDHVDRFYNKTTVVTKIVGNNNTVINSGISPQHVTAAGGVAVRPVSIRQSRAVSAASLPTRVERLSGDGRSLIVQRPQVQPTAAIPVRPGEGRGAPPVVAESGSGTRTASSSQRRERVEVPSSNPARVQSALPSGTRTTTVQRPQIAAPTETPGARTPVVRAPSAGSSTRIERPASAPAPNPASPTRRVQAPSAPSGSVARPATQPGTSRDPRTQIQRFPVATPQNQGGSRVTSPAQQMPSRELRSPAQVTRQEVPRYAPSPVQTPSTVQTPRQYSPPAQTPRQFSPPPTPSYQAPRTVETPRFSNPQPVQRESPSYSAPAPRAQSAPSYTPAPRSAPSSGDSGGGSRGSGNNRRER